MRGQHDRDSRCVTPPNVGSFKRPAGTCLGNVEEVRIEQGQQYLRLGVAETAVEFEKARSIRREHHTGVQHAGERAAFRRHLRDGLLQDREVQFGSQLRRAHGRWRIRAHTARVGTGIANICALMILRRRHGDGVDAIAEREQRHLLADQSLLQHHARTGRAERTVDEDRTNCRGRLLGRFG